ncbi:hypothetical protein Hanom_Chr14g01311401 [Helianthus anomalus]
MWSSDGGVGWKATTGVVWISVGDYAVEPWKRRRRASLIGLNYYGKFVIWKEDP